MDVPALDRLKAVEALVEETGLDRGKADRYAAHARRNLLSRRRTLSISPDVTRLAWSQGPEGPSPCAAGGADLGGVFAVGDVAQLLQG
jgi:hypothetical protein